MEKKNKISLKFRFKLTRIYILHIYIKISSKNTPKIFKNRR